MVVAPEAIDAVRFEALVARGRDQARDGDQERAAATLREALGLWRGPALADVADAPLARAEATRLEEARLAALEDRIEDRSRLRAPWRGDGRTRSPHR